VTSPAADTGGPVATRARPNKGPEVTVYFWVITVLATTVGENTADLLNVHLGSGLTRTTVLLGILFVASLVLQVRARRYVPAIYWPAVLLASLVGALLGDNLVHGLGLKLDVTTLGFMLALVITLIAWYAREKTVSIRTARGGRRELFYWAAILFTFAFGASAGDLLETLSVGYLVSAIALAAVIAVVALADRGLDLNPVATFWMVYILARPLGVAIGDFISEPRGQRDPGLGLGHFGTSAVLLVAFLVLVAHLSVSRRDQVTALAGKAEGNGGVPRQTEASFVAQYYAKLPRHSDLAFNDLTPSFQRRVGGPQGFARRLRGVLSVEIVEEPVSVGPHTVSVTVRTTYLRDRSATERLLVHLHAPADGRGRLRLDDIVWRS
jgi:uncharacterized membrane-anchored protein